MNLSNIAVLISLLLSVTGCDEQSSEANGLVIDTSWLSKAFSPKEKLSEKKNGSELRNADVDELSAQENKSYNLLKIDTATNNIPIKKRYSHILLKLSKSYGPEHWKLPVLADTKGLIEPNSQTANKWLQELTELQKTEEVTAQEQLEYCLRWLEAKPDDAKAWETLGSFFRYINFKIEALDAFKQSLLLSPENDTAWYFLGEAYETSNRFLEAIVAYKRAIRVNPKNDSAWHFLGEAYENTNQFTKAIDAYQQVVEINPKFFRVTHKFDSDSLFGQGSPVSAWTSLGDAYKKTNQIDKAFDAFHQALLIEPDELSTWYSLGETYALNGEKNKVFGVYNRLKKLNSKAAALFFKDVVQNQFSTLEEVTLPNDGNKKISSTPPNDKPSKQGTGTAFAVSGEGHALTNHHVINGCAEVKAAGRDGVAKVIASDKVNDIALLQLPGESNDFAKLNPDPGKLRQGEDIIVFGYPLNYVLSSGGNLTPGTISALTGLENNTNQIQITAPIQPGSSGSPVMDKKGDVVALVSMKLDDLKMAETTGQVGQNVNFAVNGQTVKTFLDANKVPCKTGSGFFSLEKSNADIAEEARKWTVLVECWR